MSLYQRKRFLIFLHLHFARKWLTAGVSRLGWERGLTVETEKAQSPEKTQNNAARTPSRLHAVLGISRNVRRAA